MASIIQGFEYDIFISYRQKDNRGDMWVSGFVNDLKTELESTFKEEISVYFDNDPHDGILETHDVQSSLNDKLRCLIFIPVISRTYCDPRSFAWEHEFMAFVEQASADRFGLKVRLPNGNVASRVLPVRIHDLDNDDIKLWESVLGDPLRGIEFIYKEPGVNKPLTSGDDEKKNLNNTRYRIQVNKMANAISDIISGLKSGAVAPVSENRLAGEHPGRAGEKAAPGRAGRPAFFKVRVAVIAAVIAVLIIASIFIYPALSRRNALNDLGSSGERISVAVMPFRNMTNDSTWNIWQEGIQFNLISSLSNSEELEVLQSESTNKLLQSKGYDDYARVTSSIALTVSQKLDADVFILGSISQSGNNIRISSQLIDSKTGEIFKSFHIDGYEGNILEITDSLSNKIRSYLVISVLKKEVSGEFKTAIPNSVEAYRAFLLGYKSILNGDNAIATKMFLQAVKIDSGFVYAYAWLALAYGNQGLFEQARTWCLKAYNSKDQLPFDLRVYPGLLYARYVDRSMDEEIKYARQLLELDDRVPISHWIVGSDYYTMHQYNKAIPELEKTLDIYKSWNTRPLNANYYEVLLSAYHITGNFKKEKELLKKALADFPDAAGLIRSEAILALTEGDTLAADNNIKKVISLNNERGLSDADISARIGGIYFSAGMMGRAEKYYRRALSLQPGNPDRQNDLAYFLINSRGNVAEGLELAGKALKSDPDNYRFLDTKGWGLYKEGKYREALDLIKRSWDLRPVYDYSIYTHLQEAEKAVSGQK
jgi:tetratricopeptide (TPR) repeat protein